MHRPRLFSQTWARGVAQWGAASRIASFQKGVLAVAALAATSNTATISEVVLDRTIIITSYRGGGSDTTAAQCAVRAELTNATTISAFRLSNATAAGELSYTVIEFLPGVVKNVQRGTITTTGAASGTATLSPEVNPSRTEVFCLGFTSNDSGTSAFDVLSMELVVTNGTTLTATGHGAINRTVGYCAVEWW